MAKLFWSEVDIDKILNIYKKKYNQCIMNYFIDPRIKYLGLL